jgi:hypothetical protein
MSIVAGPKSRNRLRTIGVIFSQVNQTEERTKTYNAMYSRHISVQYLLNGKLAPCPMKWLDSFSMRSFTNDSIFDDTLPIGDGEMRIGTRVPLKKLKEAMEDWFRRKSYLKKDEGLVIEELSSKAG